MTELFAKLCLSIMIEKGYTNVRVVNRIHDGIAYTYGIRWTYLNHGDVTAWTIFGLPMDIIVLKEILNWPYLPSSYKPSDELLSKI